MELWRKGGLGQVALALALLCSALEGGQRLRACGCEAILAIRPCLSLETEWEGRRGKSKTCMCACVCCVAGMCPRGYAGLPTCPHARGQGNMVGVFLYV